MSYIICETLAPPSPSCRMRTRHIHMCRTSRLKRVVKSSGSAQAVRSASDSAWAEHASYSIRATRIWTLPSE